MKHLIFATFMIMSGQIYAGPGTNDLDTFSCQTSDKSYHLKIVEKFNRAGKYVLVDLADNSNPSIQKMMGNLYTTQDKTNNEELTFPGIDSEKFDLSNGKNLTITKWTKMWCPRCADFHIVTIYQALLKLGTNQTLHFSCSLTPTPIHSHEK
jgi:hypothetical protein